MSYRTPAPWITECPPDHIERWQKKLARLSEQLPNGCIEFKGRMNYCGYGRFRFCIDNKVRETGAHRAAWLAFVGPIPDDLTVDHLCRNRICINVEHMQVVTIGDNVRRAIRPASYALPGHAKPKLQLARPQGSWYVADNYLCGHPRTLENTRVSVRPEGKPRAGYVRKECRECGVLNARHKRSEARAIREAS